MKTLIKSIMCVLVLVLVACSPYPDVVKTCANYLERDQYCGTGFFVAPDQFITAEHVVDRARSNVVTAVGPGVNETFYDFETPFAEGIDAVLGLSDHSITDNTCPICTSVVLGADVDILGNPTRFKEPSTVETTVIKILDGGDRFLLGANVPQGFSGGPVIDVERGCVIGSIEGNQNGNSVAANLTSLGH